jgi:hypothetical protein
MGLKYNWDYGGRERANHRKPSKSGNAQNLVTLSRNSTLSSEQRTEGIAGRGPARWYRASAAKG